MRTKALLALGVLAAAAMAVASTPSYEILLPKPTQAGALLLAAGQYRVWLNGSNAVFLDVASRHSFVAPVKVETTKPHEVTNIEVDKRGEARILKSIDLAGTDETLEFEASIPDAHFVEAR
jgi:hypothetical protein